MTQDSHEENMIIILLYKSSAEPMPRISETRFMHSVEGLQLVGLDWCLIFMQVREWVLGAVVVGIIVGINCLCLETCDCIKLLDGGCAKSGQSTEHSPLDFRNFGVLDGVDEGVLGLGSVILQLLGSVLFAKRRNLVEVHFQVMRHLFGQLILRCCEGNDSHAK